jgi:hypothetical protein
MAIEHVIVYVQGTHRFQGGLSIDRFATGLSQALGPEYRPNAAVERFNFQGKGIGGRLIECRDQNGAFQPSLQLIECDYYDIFEEIEEMTLIGRAIRTVKTVLPKLPLAGNIVGFSSESRLQWLYLVTLLITTILAPIALIGAVGFLVHDLVAAVAKPLADVQPALPAAAGAPSQTSAPSWASIAGYYIAGVISLLAVFKILWGGIVPKTWRAFIAMFARDPLCMLEYLTREGRSGGIADRVIARVDKAIAFAQQHHPTAKIHVVAYSFGTIVTYDWLFPRNGDTAGTAQRAVNSFIALGFPFRMIMTFWRRYFEDERSFTSLPLKRVINCSLQQDLVGTKVPDGNGMKSALASVPNGLTEFEDTLPANYQSTHWIAVSLRRMGLVVLDGVHAHASYFGFREDFSSPAFARCAEAIRNAA